MNTPDPSDEHQREIERGLQIILTPQLSRSEAWLRVRLAAQIDGCTVAELVAEGIMAAVEAIECESGDITP